MAEGENLTAEDLDVNAVKAEAAAQAEQEEDNLQELHVCKRCFLNPIACIQISESGFGQESRLC